MVFAHSPEVTLEETFVHAAVALVCLRGGVCSASRSDVLSHSVVHAVPEVTVKWCEGAPCGVTETGVMHVSGKVLRRARF